MEQGMEGGMKCLREKGKNKKRRRRQCRRTEEMREMVRCLSPKRRKSFQSWKAVKVGEKLLYLPGMNWETPPGWNKETESVRCETSSGEWPLQSVCVCVCKMSDGAGVKFYLDHIESDLPHPLRPSVHECTVRVFTLLIIFHYFAVNGGRVLGASERPLKQKSKLRFLPTA